ncbi:MAG: N-acetylmuramoyl-L-alanine amidase [Candidatus Eremiobacteraeota bacterium]|nr:N-acetylmuramoyl-L-alanine amidase [Candidatus Eremiobacteraeota bacterium]
MALSAAPAWADATITATYGSQTIRFTHVASQNGSEAIGTQDPGFAALLRATGAVLTWKPGERYVMITTAVPVVVSFSVGDRRYDVGPISLQAAFAPYQSGSEVYLPFDEVLRALDLDLRQDGTALYLQPQLASLDVSTQGGRATIVAHGGAPLRPRVVSQNGAAVVYEFDGVGTTLTGTRAVNAAGIRTLQIAQTGSVRDPKTLVTVTLSPGASVQPPHSNDDRDVVLAFGGTEQPQQTQSVQQPAPNAPQDSNAAPAAAAPAAAAPAGPAIVTGVTVQQTADGYTVSIAVSGNAAFEWHRLRDPDNRFWVDISGAQLQGPPIEQDEPDPLVSLRVRQNDPQTVRVAISLLGPKALGLSPSATGLNVEVSRQDASDVARSGSGSIGSVISSNEQQEALVTPAPIDENDAGDGNDTTWKFGPRDGSDYVPSNPRLIVIDPGHGGSDPGSQHGALREADLTLDMANRLRDLLTARGWQVRMTRDTDVDVYGADASAKQELQARDDVANNAGARMFVSLHANAFINSGPYGTTCYISKQSDWALARIVNRHLASDGTKNDGIVKSHLYVTLHAHMPAVLIETAFLTNPDDYALLSSSAWRQKVAQEIADGIGEYAQAYPVSNQPAL